MSDTEEQAANKNKAHRKEKRKALVLLSLSLGLDVHFFQHGIRMTLTSVFRSFLEVLSSLTYVLLQCTRYCRLIVSVKMY